MIIDTYRRIAKVDLRFPASMSADARDLVSKVSIAIQFSYKPVENDYASFCNMTLPNGYRLLMCSSTLGL